MPARSAPGSNRGSAFASAARWWSGRPTSATPSRRGRCSPGSTRATFVSARTWPAPRWPAPQVNLQQAEADFKRYRDLRDQGFISGAELERRETTLKVAQAQLAQARAQSGVQGNQAAYAALTADAAGVITGVDVEPGMVVAAGAPVLRLAHDGPRDVVFSVPEDKVALVQAVAARQGPVQVRLWSSDRDAVPATIREISAAADPVTRTFLVKADLGSAATAPRLGQTATVAIAAPRLAGVARVPLSALKEHQGGSSVWIVDPASHDGGGAAGPGRRRRRQRGDRPRRACRRATGW